ncbi:MAG: glycine cleavage T C-terminal barrel domain-containing protein, partial [Pseudomonadota bacterium]
LEIDGDGICDGHGGEAVLHNGSVVGTTSSVVYGHSVGVGLAFAYIKPAAAAPETTLEVMILGKKRPARVLANAAYDPQSERPRVDASDAT